MKAALLVAFWATFALAGCYQLTEGEKAVGDTSIVATPPDSYGVVCYHKPRITGAALSCVKVLQP